MPQIDRLNIELLKPLDEARYLTAENAARYRVILRFFYEQHQRLRYWLYKEDIFDYMKQFEVFSDYTIEKCEQDLNALTQWKNLISTQDTAKASTLEEFKNKKFRYQLSPYSIEIERMTIRLESLSGYGGSLEPSLFERIYTSLLKTKEFSASSDTAAIHRWWQDLNGDFESIYHNATDYIASLQSSRADELMKTEAFIVYKDRMIDYLRDFIKDLQRFSSAIEEFLKNLDEDVVNSVVERLVEYELSVPRIDRIPEAGEVRGEIKSKWFNLTGWFLGYGGDESEAYRLFSVTNEIIRKITRFAARIAESRSRTLSRKTDYLKLAAAFAGCKDLNEAHRLSAAAFGAFNTRHLAGEFERATESITVGVWDEKPCTFKLKPKTRNYSESGNTGAVRDCSESKSQKLKEYLMSLEQEREILEGLIFQNRINLAKLPEVEPFVRITLLRWIGKAMGSRNKTAKTEDGRQYRVIFPKDHERVWLKCTDGNINMPAFIIEFEDVG
ncbi:MAG TPA: TIGR02677 family protein [Thermoanaerobacterales bacterium]|nr:TIGR02677 family protein [Thermoanaerobacterales bacterium]